MPPPKVIAQVLIEDAIDDLRGRGVSGIWCWTHRGHPNATLLSRMGLRDTYRHTGLRYQPRLLTPEERSLFASPKTRIHLMGGDSNIM